MLSKTGDAETITSHYLFALGMYRALYILNWIYRYHFEEFFDPIAVVSGCVQTVLYGDFFYLYVTRGTHFFERNHEKFSEIFVFEFVSVLKTGKPILPT